MASYGSRPYGTTPYGATSGASIPTTNTGVEVPGSVFGVHLFFDASDAVGGNTQPTARGDWKLADGREALRQAIIRRILTNPLCHDKTGVFRHLIDGVDVRCTDVKES